MDPVLVGIAGREGSPAAVRWGQELAGLLGAPLTVASVVEDESTERQPGESDDASAMLRRDSVQKLLDDAGATDAALDVRVGDPLSTLLGLVDERQAAMVVVAHEDGGDHAAGSEALALELLQRGHRTVAVVPHTYQPLQGGKFVVGIDGTKANSPALAQAEHLARAANGSITAVFAYDPVDDTFVLPEGWHRHSDEVRAELARVRSVPVDLVMEPGEPDDVISAIAERENAAAVIVGTHGGHHWFGGHGSGHVPTRLLHKASCPTIAVPH
jgi:nucleotide-binding universal stress UspA family protein